MRKKQLYIASLTIILCSFLFQKTAIAQDYTKIFDFKKGTGFQSEINVVSNATVKRGKQVLNVSSTNDIVKSYKIENATDLGYKVIVQVNKMKGSIDVNKVKISFDSDIKTDSTSRIINGLSYILHKPIAVTLNRNGVVQDFEAYKVEMATDTLTSFAGIEPEIFKKTELINFLADFTYKKYIEKGYTWTSNFTNGDQKSTTKFLVDYLDEKTTILKFFKTATSNLLNTNSNGTYVIDNSTGLITEKYMYVISVGYQISAGGIVYAVSRASNISEKTKFIP